MCDSRTVVKRMNVDINNNKAGCMVKYAARGGVLWKKRSDANSRHRTRHMVHCGAGYVHLASIYHVPRSSRTLRRVR